MRLSLLSFRLVRDFKEFTLSVYIHTNITTFSVFFQYLVVKVHINFKIFCSKNGQVFIKSNGDQN